MKIKFTKTTLPEDGPIHKEGEVLEVSEASAEFWFVRGAAEPVDPKAKAAEPEPAADESEHARGKGRR